MNWLNDILAQIGGTVLAVIIVITGAFGGSQEPVQPVLVTTSTVATTTAPEGFTMPQIEVYNPEKPVDYKVTTPPVIVIPVVIPPPAPQPVPVAPQPVYNDPMPKKVEGCVEEVKITSFTIGTSLKQDYPTRNATSTIFTPNVRVTAKCTDTLDFEIKTDVPMGEGEYFGYNRTRTTTLKDGDKYLLNLVEPLGYTTEPHGTFKFTVTIKKDGVLLETKEASITI